VLFTTPTDMHFSNSSRRFNFSRTISSDSFNISKRPSHVWVIDLVAAERLSWYGTYPEKNVPPRPLHSCHMR